MPFFLQLLPVTYSFSLSHLRLQPPAGLRLFMSPRLMKWHLQRRPSLLYHKVTPSCFGPSVPLPFLGPVGQQKWWKALGFAVEGRCGAWDGNRPEDALSLPCGLSWCLGPTLHLDYLGNLTLHRLLFPFPLPSVDVCELGRGLQRKHGYRNTRRWEGLPDSTPKWKAGAWSSGRQSKLPTHPIILGLLQRYSFPASLL